MRESAATDVGSRSTGATHLSTSILVVDDEPGIRKFLQRSLAGKYALVETAADVSEAESLRQRCYFDLLIVDIRMPGMSGTDWLDKLREQGLATDVIFITAHADLETAIQALRAGASDFLLKPFRMEQMLSSVERCLKQRRMSRENFVLRRELDKMFAPGEAFVGTCKVMREVCELIKRIAPTPSTVLIEGESGTGKELAARSLHAFSGRNGPFVPINCGAISPELLESELFGHVKGAFTGAHQSREGLFSYASEGTLFLDEIGEMPLAMQAKLLRFLEERTIRPVGSNRETALDVRVVAATNRDLAETTRRGGFREDLYYRLNVLTVRMPALRDHSEDLELLTRHFMATLAAELGVRPPQLSAAEFRILASYDWPGNVRELRNVVERSLLLGRRPSECLMAQQQVAAAIPDSVSAEAASLTLEEVEKRHILHTLAAAAGNKSEAARKLRVSRKTLERKLKAWSAQQAAVVAID